MLNAADTDFKNQLSAVLPDGIIGPVDEKYTQEPRGKWFGHAGFVVRPKTVEQVSLILKTCNGARVGVLPYGGGTGLVGGQIMPDGPAPVILSLERMNAVISVNPLENVLVAESGAILSEIQTQADAVNRLFPLSLASQGSALIGGNLATNAGGVNVVRYGNARDLCLGVQAVLADGSVFNGLSRLRKDNTGYDLRNLLVGSEGTLGVITAASLKLFPKPTSIGTALFQVADPKAALELLALSRDVVGETVSTFELIAQMGITFLAETIPGVKCPLDPCPEWMVLMEIGTTTDANDHLTEIFERAAARGLVEDGVIAMSDTQRNALWSVRENMPTANRLVGAIASHDISLPLAMIPDYIAAAPAKVAAVGDFRINCFGHLGDGNLHYNIFPPKGGDKGDYKHLSNDLQRVVHDLAIEMGGSFSAEHGVGRQKSDDLIRYGDPTKLKMMHAIKDVLDPNGILNPGAVLRR